MSQTDDSVVKDPTSAGDPSASSASKDDHMIPKTRLDEEIQKRKNLQEKVDALEAQSKKAEQDRLKEKEDYKGLYETVLKENADLKPKAQVVEDLEKTLKTVLDAQVAELPEQMRTLVPAELTTQQKLNWLSANKSILTKAKPVDIGAGKHGGGEGKSIDLTDEEKKMATDFGMSFEDYAKNKFK